MAYIGQPPFQEFTSIPTKDNFTGDGSTTTFDLAGEVPLGAENALEVFVANVRQEPGTGKAFTLGQDGNGDFKRITFASAPADGAAIYVMYTGVDGRSFTALTQLPQDLDGAELILDGDGDTSITSDTDDQIDIKISGADDFSFTANAFNVLTGSHATFADSANAKFGTGSDMLLYHDGTNSYITNAVGALKIATETSGIAVTIGHTTSEVTIADNATVAGNLTVTGTLTQTGSQTFDGGIDVDNFNINGTTIALSSGDMTLDSAGDIILDADGGDVFFKDAGTTFGSATNTSGNLIIKSGTTTALTFSGANVTAAGTITGNLTGNVTGTADVATVATTVTITDNEATNENNAVIFTAGGDVDGGNIGLESDGDLTYNPSTGTLNVPNISVTGTQTIVNSVTMNASNAVIFEGATADAYETTLSTVDATADITINLPNVAGTLPVLAVASTTAITSTPEELNKLDGATVTVGEINLIDGDTSRGTTAVASGDGILINDGGTMRMTNVDTVSTYFSSHNVGGGNIVTTGALNSGTITSGFGTINNGSSTITTTGAVATGAITAGGNIIIPDAGNIGSASDTDAIAIASNGVTTFSQIPVLPANSIDSDYYVDGSIDTAHIGALQVTGAKLALDHRSANATDDVKTGNQHDYIFFDADVGISFFSANAEDMRLTDAGALHVDDDIIAFSTTISDERLKENIQPIEDALSKVNQLRGVTFTYISDGRDSAGLIAQDVEKVLPSAVRESELPLQMNDGKDYKILQYDQTIGLLVESIKELTAKVEKLEKK